MFMKTDYVAMGSFFTFLLIGLVSAVILAQGGGTAFSSINESTAAQYNFSVNNTQATVNITEVNITIPSGFAFISDSNATDSTTTTFTNTSTILTWVNSSAAALVANGSINYFWFNTTSSATPGDYNFTVTSSNSTGVFETQNISITVNDTVAPSSIEFASPSEVDNANLSTTYIFVNVTAVDAGTLDNILIRLYNSSGSQINSSLGSSSPTSINFTGLTDGTYYFNATANDTVGNTNDSAIRTIVLDTVAPSSIEFASPSEVDNANLSVLYAAVNVTAADAVALDSILIRLYNSSGSQVNSSTSSTSPAFINFTGLSDGTYYFNATVNDSSGNTNDSATRTFTVDTVAPSSIEFASPSEVDNANLSVSYVAVNVTAVDAGTLDNILVRLYNSSGALINSSTGSASPTFINFTGLSDGTYYFNATANDTVGNSNDSVTRNLTIDTVDPVVTFSCSPTSVTAGATITCTCSATDADTGVASTTYTANPSTSTAGTFSTTCTVADYAGNSVVSSVSYTVTTAATSSGGSGFYPTYSASITDLSTGYDISLGKGYKVNFDLAGESHVLKVDSVSGDKVKITISSTPVTFELAPGQTKKVDADDDGIYDLDVYLKGVSISRANVILTAINEEIPAVTSGTKVDTNIEPTREDPAIRTEEIDKGFITGNVVLDAIESNGLVVFLIILLIVLVVIVITYWKKIQKQFL